MALTKIKEIVCLLDLDWTGRKKLDGGLVRIGSVDGRDDLTGHGCNIVYVTTMVVT